MSKLNKYENVIQKSFVFAQKKGYKSYDGTDFKKSIFYNIARKTSNKRLKQLALLPYNKLIKHYPELARKFVKEKGYKYPQGQAMIIRALVLMLKKGSPLGDIEEAKKEADWLIGNRSKLSKHFGWGQPYLWYSKIPIPANTPRATVSSQVAWAMLDLFDYTQDERYLDVAKDVCYLFKNEFTHTRDKNNNICLSYTTMDDFTVHNASILAGSVLMRVYKLLEIDEIGNLAFKVADFTKEHQNQNGSFYYWAPPHKVMKVIDNYHTGFVLESYRTIKNDCGDSRYDKLYDTGMSYYYNNLFEGPIPRISDKNTYPINIQSSAQSIITFMLDDSKDSQRYKTKAVEIADYTINEMFLEEKSHFVYKIHENRIDKSYYFRWGDAWMIRALAYLL